MDQLPAELWNLGVRAWTRLYRWLIPFIRAVFSSSCTIQGYVVQWGECYSPPPLHSFVLVCPTCYGVDGVQFSTEGCDFYLAIRSGEIRAVLCDVGGRGSQADFPLWQLEHGIEEEF